MITACKYLILEEGHCHLQPNGYSEKQTAIRIVAKGQEKISEEKKLSWKRTLRSCCFGISGDLLKNIAASTGLSYDLNILKHIDVYGDGANWINTVLDDESLVSWPTFMILIIVSGKPALWHACFLTAESAERLVTCFAEMTGTGSASL